MKLNLSKVLPYLCLAFISGIVLNFLQNQSLIHLILFGGILFLTFLYFFLRQFSQKQKLKIGGLILMAVLVISFSTFGWMRYEAKANPTITRVDLSYFNDYNQEIIVIGIVTRVEQRVKNNRLVVKAENIIINEKKLELEGQVMAFVSRLVEINYGDQIELRGRLISPRIINGFNWPKHLANDNIRSVMFRPWVTIKKEDQGNVVMAKVHATNSLFQERINQVLPYPESTILSAMLLGNRGEIPERISSNFRRIGLGHILAISGLHITIIASIFFWLILAAGLWRKHAFIITSFFLIFFILMIGAPPSAIRAGIMGFLFLLSQYFGRNYNLSNAVIFTAFLILIFNPLSLFWDISFQFSFAAILSILFFVPILQFYFFEKLKKTKVIKTIKKHSILYFLSNTFLISGAILLFLGPLMAYYFGNFPIVSPLVNLLAIPLLPLILFFGIITLFVSLVSLNLSLIPAGIIYLTISSLTYFSNLIANLPLIELFIFENIPVYLLIGYYLVLVIIIYKLKKTISPFLLLKF